MADVAPEGLKKENFESMSRAAITRNTLEVDNENWKSISQLNKTIALCGWALTSTELCQPLNMWGLIRMMVKSTRWRRPTSEILRAGFWVNHNRSLVWMGFDLDCVISALDMWGSIRMMLKSMSWKRPTSKYDGQASG